LYKICFHDGNGKGEFYLKISFYDANGFYRTDTIGTFVAGIGIYDTEHGLGNMYKMFNYPIRLGDPIYVQLWEDDPWPNGDDLVIYHTGAWIRCNTPTFIPYRHHSASNQYSATDGGCTITIEITVFSNGNIV